MAFTFLNPWFWLGAVALAAPIWLHLRRRQERNSLWFSTLRFLEDYPVARQSPLRLRQLLLFALRALAMLALIAAFAWPYLPEQQRAVIKESRVYILDNTMSHQAGNGFRLDREKITREFGNADSTVQIAVVELTAQPRVLVAFGDDRVATREKLQNLQPSSTRGSYLAAFRLAQSLLGDSLGEHKRIVFCGDGQANQWTEEANVPPFLYQVAVDMPAMTITQRPNLSIGEPRVQRVFLGDKTIMNVSAQLHHAGEAKTAVVTLRTNGQVAARNMVDLAGQPETVMLQSQWEIGPDWLAGDIEVTGAPDHLPGDNRAYFSLAPVHEGKLLLLAQSPFLRLALSPDVMRGQWSTRRPDPSKISAELATDLEAEVFCLESSYLQSTEVRQLAWRYLTQGRGLVVLVNRTSPLITGALREMGFEVEASSNTSRRHEDKFQFMAVNHPLFRPFFSADLGNLLEVKFQRFTRLKSTEALPLAFLEKGGPVIFQGTRPPQKLFVLAFGMDREHCSWPLHLSFIPFLDQILQAARAEPESLAGFEPGELAQLHLPEANEGQRAALLEGDQVLAQAVVTNRKVQFRVPEKPGIYALKSTEAPGWTNLVAVNPSPKESALTYTDPGQTVALWQMSPAMEQARAALQTPAPLLRKATAWHQDYWWWLLIAGLTALALEILLAGRRAEV